MDPAAGGTTLPPRTNTSTSSGRALIPSAWTPLVWGALRLRWGGKRGGKEGGRQKKGEESERRKGKCRGQKGRDTPLIQIPASALAAPRVNSRVYVPVCRSDLREGDGAVSDVE